MILLLPSSKSASPGVSVCFAKCTRLAAGSCHMRKICPAQWIEFVGVALPVHLAENNSDSVLRCPVSASGDSLAVHVPGCLSSMETYSQAASPQLRFDTIFVMLSSSNNFAATTPVKNPVD